MAQNLTIAGASYSDVPAVNIAKTGGGIATFTDVSDSTVTPETLLEGETAYNAAGELITGTAKAGGGAPAAEKDVNFYDYDGTLLYSYTLEEAQALTELPALPTREGLTCQGWNYDLATIKSYGRKVNVGATYITDDGTTRIYIKLEDGRTSPCLLYTSPSPRDRTRSRMPSSA